ncbi:MAG: hypothetical protein QOD86_982 [Miltoncostaeaceae bacterium]|nr:hypothetical protein [Miltoncostaeaceae bacterium]
MSAGAAPPPGDPFATPRTTLVTVLNQFWRHSDDDAQLRARWADYARRYDDQVDRFLAGLEAVAADPPDDLREVISEEGWRPLYHDADTVPRPYSVAESAAWLREQIAMLREVAGRSPAPPRG